MSVPVDAHMQPFLLQGSRGALFATYYRPPAGTTPRGDVLVVPAFGEEMNRCRAMVSKQAQAFARLGIGTLVLDPYGTGDSAGEFVEGSWALWRDDLRLGIEWLRSSGNGCRWLWGIRLGAIMAAELAQHDSQIEHLLLWQPVVDGKAFFTSFLRIRIAAEMEQEGGIKSTDELRRMAAAGGAVEVSGYNLGAQLCGELDTLKFPAPPALAHVSISWCEVLAAADASVPRSSTKVIESLSQAGVTVTAERVVGPAFWQLHEREVAPDLIELSKRRLNNEVREMRASQPAAKSASQVPLVDMRVARERPVAFACENEHLAGMLHTGSGNVRRGVVIVVAGGPQYRAGAHRQFVSLARKLAGRGNAVMRFDLRGMGDSSGEYRGFQHSSADIRSAIDALIREQPQISEIVLFGECESASGILFYAYRDPRVQGAVLVNPWVRTEGGRAGVIMKHYYLDRLMSGDFWKKIRSGQFDVRGSVASFFETLRVYLKDRKVRKQTANLAASVEELPDLPLPQKTAAGLRRFNGRALVLMSGHDYIAREFDEVVRTSAAWEGLMEQTRICRKDVPGADHTFSREPWKRQASDWICEWVGSW